MRSPEREFPSANRGTVVFLHALDVNWGARMSEVRVTGLSYFTEVCTARSDRNGDGRDALQAINIERELPISRIGYSSVQSESGTATVPSASASFLSQSRQPQLIEVRVVPARRLSAPVAVSLPSADIFEEMTKTSEEVRSSSRINAIGCSASAYPPIADRNPRSSNSSERGLRPCL